MEPYWKQEFDVSISGKDKHLVQLYQYSERSVALISTPEFGRSFSKYFKEAEGRFNKGLKINDEVVSGWIFKAQNNTLETLNNFLKEIYEGNLKPTFSGIVKPDFDSKSKNNKIFNLITKLMDMLPEENEQFVLGEENNIKTTIYFNPDDDTVTEGDLVYSFEGGKKKLEIYQLNESV